jgi:hypothetical protein
VNNIEKYTAFRVVDEGVLEYLTQQGWVLIEALPQTFATTMQEEMPKPPDGFGSGSVRYVQKIVLTKGHRYLIGKTKDLVVAELNEMMWKSVDALKSAHERAQKDAAALKASTAEFEKVNTENIRLLDVVKRQQEAVELLKSDNKLLRDHNEVQSKRITELDEALQRRGGRLIEVGNDP